MLYDFKQSLVKKTIMDGFGYPLHHGKNIIYYTSKPFFLVFCVNTFYYVVLFLIVIIFNDLPEVIIDLACDVVQVYMMICYHHVLYILQLVLLKI